MTTSPAAQSGGAIAICAPRKIAEVAAMIARQAGLRRVFILEKSHQIEDLMKEVELDVILVDEAVEGPPDFELTRRLSALPGGTPSPFILLMAAAPTRRLVDQARAAGIAGMLAKPFSARQLRSSVARRHVVITSESALATGAVLD